jgi:anti-anti-sigma factor
MFLLARSAFELEREGDTLIVTHSGDLRELDHREVEVAARDVFRLLGYGAAWNVVLDFRHTDYFGSTALAFFIELYQQVQVRGGDLAFCNLSTHEREILAVTKLGGLWPLCASREEAIRVVRG